MVIHKFHQCSIASHEYRQLHVPYHISDKVDWFIEDGIQFVWLNRLNARWDFLCRKSCIRPINCFFWNVPLIGSRFLLRFFCNLNRNICHVYAIDSVTIFLSPNPYSDSFQMSWYWLHQFTVNSPRFILTSRILNNVCHTTFSFFWEIQ